MISLNVNKLSVSAIINQRRNVLLKYMLPRWRGSLVALCKFQYETAPVIFPMVKTNYMLLYYLSIYSFWPANVCKCAFFCPSLKRRRRHHITFSSTCYKLVCCSYIGGALRFSCCKIHLAKIAFYKRWNATVCTGYLSVGYVLAMTIWQMLA